MLLQFQSPYASISQFTPVEITDFTVLTGVNGSGKSHLLEAINLRKVVIANMQKAHIVHFNYENFRLDNEPTFTGHQLSAERESAWQFFERKVKPQAANWRADLGSNYPTIKDQALTERKSFWAVGGIC